MTPLEQREDATTLVTQAVRAREQIDALRTQGHAAQERLNAERRRLEYDVYEPKIRALRDELNEATEKVELAAKAEELERQKQVEALAPAVQHVERIISLLKLEPKDLAIDDEDIHVRKSWRNDAGEYKECLGVLYEDTHLRIKAYIAANEKPKNKFSLLAFGKSDINLGSTRDNRLFSYGYGLDTYELDWYSLKACLREAPTVEELKTWLENNRESVKARLLGKYPEVKKEYEEVRQAYRLEDFTPFLEAVPA